MTVSVWLTLLAAEGSSARERNDAATKLHGAVSSWAGGYLRTQAPCPMSDDDVDEATQHLLMRAATGTSRFRGASDAEARAWCIRVLVNKARDVCRQRRRYRSTTSVGPSGEESLPEPAVEPSLGETAARQTGDILRSLEVTLPRLHRARDVVGIVASFRCFLQFRLGATIEEQIEAFAQTEVDPDATAADPAGERVRARNRVYQYRARGRKAACEALAALFTEQGYTVDDLSEVARVLGCGAAVRSERSVAS
jgi:DNA-directed RNA polymerase specialized sigma24 family protein